MKRIVKNVPRRSQLMLAHIACAGLGLLLSAEQASAQVFTGASAWSVAGSTGVADESSTSLVAFDNTAGVAFRPTAPAGSIAIIRYPVSFLPSTRYDVFTGWSYVFNHLRLAMTFRKPDDDSYASATLKRVRLSDGVVTSMTSVNTFGYLPGTNAQQSEWTIACGESACISPSEYAYFIELVLWKPQIANAPKVVALRVHTWFDY